MRALMDMGIQWPGHVIPMNSVNGVFKYIRGVSKASDLVVWINNRGLNQTSRHRNKWHDEASSDGKEMDSKNGRTWRQMARAARNCHVPKKLLEGWVHHLKPYIIKFQFYYSDYFSHYVCKKPFRTNQLDM